VAEIQIMESAVAQIQRCPEVLTVAGADASTTRACSDMSVGARSHPDPMSGGGDGGGTQMGLVGFVDELTNFFLLIN